MAGMQEAIGTAAEMQNRRPRPEGAGSESQDSLLKGKCVRAV
jgi:hypothetical protein